MKTKLLYGLLSFAVGLIMISCSDEVDYSIAKDTLVTEITTGSADVTAISAVMHGTVDGLDDQSSEAYEVGFNFGTSSDSLNANIGALDGNTITVTKLGLTNNTTYYYQAYVILQGKVTYTGEVKSLVTTDAVVTTKTTTGGMMKATVGGTLEDYPTGTDITCGIVMSMSSVVEDVRAGLIIKNSALTNNFSIEQKGLLPGKTYYYAAYLNLGSGIVYGDVESFTTQTYELDIDNDFVDLGLSRKWAKYNLGASTEAEYGGLFAYGDLTGLNNSTNVADYGQESDIYLTSFDICYSVYPNTTLPTADDFAELFNSCTYVWTTKDGVSGYEFTAPNNNTLFLPAAGSRTGNNVTNIGDAGAYLTGSINSGSTDFCKSFSFGEGYADKSVSPRYTALAVRPVSTARNVPFMRDLLNNVWLIDVDTNAVSVEFNGPVYFYGTDDSWATVTNHEPIIGDSWTWEAEQADWICPAAEFGTMTFGDNDTVTVVQVDANGMETTASGPFTIDEENKTITLGVDLLTPYNFSTEAGEGLTQVDSKQTQLKILSLSENKLQIAVVRTEGPALLAINYVPNIIKNGYQAKLTCYGATDDPNANVWASATTRLMPEEGSQYTLTFTGQRNNGQVYILDIPDFAADHPNAFIRIDDILADGVSIKYDANKFYYGNIENNGTYRVELANIWGLGGTGSGLADSPFSNVGETNNETNLAFDNTFAVTFTIVSLNMDLNFEAHQTAVGLETGWNMPGTWDNDQEIANVSVLFENNQYSLATTDPYSITYNTTVAVPNGAVNLIDIRRFASYFIKPVVQLTKVTNDGADVSFLPDKILYGDIEGNGNIRIELYNIWGSGTASDPPFGNIEVVEGNNCTADLGYTASTTYEFTVSSLFEIPVW